MPLILVGLLALAHVFLLSKLVFLPYPELFIYTYLTNQGLVPYREIFDQHFPGLMFFPVNLGTLGMTTPADARLWQYGVVVLTHILLYIVARKLFGPKKAILANVFYFIWHPFFEGWVLWIDSFIPLFLLPAFYFVAEFFNVKKYSSRLKLAFAAGLFLGTALVLKQVVLPLCGLVGLVILMKTKEPRYLVSLIFGAAIPLSAMLIYVTKLAMWTDFFFWTASFNLGTFAQMGRKYPTFSDLVRVGVTLGLPVLMAGRLYIKGKSIKIFIPLLFLAGTLVFAYARFDPVHLQPAIPFVALLAIYGLDKTPKYVLKALLFIYIMISVALLFRFYKGHLGDKVYFFGSQEAQLAELIKSRTNPGDKIFAFATTPHIYQMTDTLPSGNIFVFHFPWFLTEAEDRLLKGLREDPPKVVLREKNAFVEGKVLVKYAPVVDNYINTNFKLLKMVGPVEVLVPR